MGLPFLDCFLNNKGQAQTNGRALPTRSILFSGAAVSPPHCGFPRTAGTDYEITVQLKPLEPYRKKLNIFSGLRVPLDSKPNGQHWSGLAAAIPGIAPFRGGGFRVQTIDQQVAEVIGKGVRFRSVAASSSGDPERSYSSLGGTDIFPSEPTPLSLYTRLFGPESGSDKGQLEARSANPDAEERAVRGRRRSQARHADPRHQRPGTHQSYFTSVRQTELQMEAELRRPPSKRRSRSRRLLRLGGYGANAAWPNLKVRVTR